ncbi:MAG: disulfide bond formation protein B [Burkholderiaceae bacterium]
MGATTETSARADGPRFRSGRRVWALLAVGVGLGSVGIALWLQHRSDLLPCAWCVLQRLQALVVVVLALLVVVLPGLAARFTGWLGVGVAITGLAAALHQQFNASKDLSCALTLADRVVGSLGLDSRWPDVFQAQAMCNEANVPWMGVPFALWGAAMFIVLIVCLGVAATRERA